MSSMVHDRSNPLAGPTPQKRDSTHLALHSPPKRLKAIQTLGVAGSSLLSPIAREDSAGRYKAEEWFEDTDKNASRDVSFPDNDPPFYINRRSSSGGSSVCAVRSDGTSLKHPTLSKPTAPTRALLAEMEYSRSNSEDFRSVIDDLTIQNKKLKKKLRQYERLHCSHLQNDKMFEVRIHGLAAQQRRDLEETLRSFASSIGESSPERPIINPSPMEQSTASSGPIAGLQKAAAGVVLITKSSALCKPSSTSTSGSKPVDSAYASMSGRTWTSQLHSQEKGNPNSIARASQTQQSVKSYLHDIPEILVPKHSMEMSERLKSKLVVRRLEQIFIGRGAASRRHTQSHQQQEVSHSAAQADRIRLETQGRGRQLYREGAREARISDDVDIQVDSLSVTQPSRQSSNEGRSSITGTHLSRNNSPNQRPTRPLDLDLHRAQIPEENIDYIRHLNLSAETDHISPDADAGWVYLNLLSSMAQLHTLNVTPGFIRNAIADVSSQFELSTDGTKVKWMGGTEGTRLSSESDESSDMEKIKSTRPGLSTNTRGSPTRLSSNLEAIDRQEPNSALPAPAYEWSTDRDLGTKRVPVFLAQANSGANFHYKPLFFHGVPSEEDDDSRLATDSGVSSNGVENATGMHSGINSGSHGLRETEVRLRKQNAENGPIIFYHKARFCTDLSGDSTGGHVDGTAYHRYSEDPIGCTPNGCHDSRDKTTVDMADSMIVDYGSIDAAGAALDLDDLKSCISGCFSSSSSAVSALIPLEVSGLGGIQPDDNFVVKVQVYHRDNRKAALAGTQRHAPHTIYRVSHTSGMSTSGPKDLPRSHPIRVPVNSEIVSTVTKKIKPSTLPSPLGFHSPFSSSESENEKGVESEAAIPYFGKSRSSREAGPAIISAKSPSEAEPESSYASTPSESDDDSSIDLLAHARELDPDAVAACEREFDINLLPAASVAATAGQSSSGLVKAVQQADSDMDSMSVDEDGFSRMADSD